MSRVVYANTQATPEQEALRDTNRVRLVTDAEEGMGANALPAGVYGFTYSPALENSPLFATRRFRTYETHKRHDGSVWLLGFVSDDDAAKLDGPDTVEVCLQPEPEPGVERFVAIAYSRIRHHRLISVRDEHGITMKVSPKEQAD